MGRPRPRLTLAAVPEGSQDLVIGDAFGGVSVPWHLTTREFVTMIHDRLRPDGVYAKLHGLQMEMQVGV